MLVVRDCEPHGEFCLWQAHAGDMQTQLAKAIAQVRELEESKYWLQASNVLLRNSSLVHFNEGGQVMSPTYAGIYDAVVI